MPHQNPLVSFVLLSYKQAPFIREAVEGAFAQSYSPLEIIISDDFSPDRTFEIIQEMAASYRGPHKVVLNRTTRNLGLGAHLTNVLKMTSGEWVVVAAGDDISLPERTSILLETAARNSAAGGVWSSYEMIEENGETIDFESPYSQDFVVNHAKASQYTKGYPRRNPIQAGGCTAAWHKDVFAVNDYVPADCHVEDLFLSMRAIALGRDLCYTGKKLVRYRAHDSNISRNTAEGDESIKRITAFSDKVATTHRLIAVDIERLLKSGQCRPENEADLIELNRNLAARENVMSGLLVGSYPSLGKMWNLRNHLSPKHFIKILWSKCRAAITVSKD